MMSKKGEGANFLVYLMIAVVVVLVVIVGYSVISRASGQAAVSKTKQFESKLSADLQVTAEGNALTKSYEVAAGYNTMCIVSEPDAVRAAEHPFRSEPYAAMVIDALDAGYNVFIIKDEKNIQKFTIDDFSLDPRFHGVLCLPVESGTVELRLYGFGGETLVDRKDGFAGIQTACTPEPGSTCVSGDYGLSMDIPADVQLPGGETEITIETLDPENIPSVQLPGGWPEGLDPDGAVVYDFGPDGTTFPGDPMTVQMAYSPPFSRENPPLLFHLHNRVLEPLPYTIIDEHILEFTLNSFSYVVGARLGGITLRVAQATSDSGGAAHPVCAADVLWDHSTAGLSAYAFDYKVISIKMQGTVDLSDRTDNDGKFAIPDACLGSADFAALAACVVNDFVSAGFDAGVVPFDAEEPWSAGTTGAYAGYVGIEDNADYASSGVNEFTYIVIGATTIAVNEGGDFGIVTSESVHSSITCTSSGDNGGFDPGNADYSTLETALGFALGECANGDSVNDRCDHDLGESVYTCPRDCGQYASASNECEDGNDNDNDGCEGWVQDFGGGHGEDPGCITPTDNSEGEQVEVFNETTGLWEITNPPQPFIEPGRVCNCNGVCDPWEEAAVPVADNTCAGLWSLDDWSCPATWGEYCMDCNDGGSGGNGACTGSDSTPDSSPAVIDGSIVVEDKGEISGTKFDFITLLTDTANDKMHLVWTADHRWSNEGRWGISNVRYLSAQGDAAFAGAGEVIPGVEQGCCQWLTAKPKLAVTTNGNLHMLWAQPGQGGCSGTNCGMRLGLATKVLSSGAWSVEDNFIQHPAGNYLGNVDNNNDAEVDCPFHCTVGNQRIAANGDTVYVLYSQAQGGQIPTTEFTWRQKFATTTALPGTEVYGGTKDTPIIQDMVADDSGLFGVVSGLIPSAPVTWDLRVRSFVGSSWEAEQTLLTLSNAPIYVPDAAISPTGEKRIVWMEWHPTADNAECIRGPYFVKQLVGGSWTPKAKIGNLIPDAAKHESPPQIAADSNGVWYVVWVLGGTDLYVSVDTGNGWSAKQVVGTIRNTGDSAAYFDITALPGSEGGIRVVWTKGANTLGQADVNVGTPAT
ncbi:MAG: hypothetical protein V1659_04950 [Candidatus Woesearchaeota archaeon]